MTKIHSSLVLAIVLFLAGCALSPGGPTTGFPERSVTVSIIRSADLSDQELSRGFELAQRHIRGELGVTLTVAAMHQFKLDKPINRRSVSLFHRAFPSDGQPDIILVCLGPDSLIPLLTGTSKEGWSEGIGLVGRRKRNVAFVRAGSGASHTARVMMHEIGHLLGATHSSRGVMVFDSSLIRFATGYSTVSRREIRQSLGTPTWFRSS